MQRTPTLKQFPYTLMALALVIAIVVVGIVIATGVLGVGAPSSAAQPSTASSAINSTVGLIGANTVDVTVNGNRER
ncbi:MAG: hypothetical protein FJ009_07190 [Chloroflexi bacterium]|nr:hypothetical protein [Chloroflexota bacterium]